MIAMKSKVWIGQPTRKSCMRICLPLHTFDLRAMDGQSKLLISQQWRYRYILYILNVWLTQRNIYTVKILLQVFKKNSWQLCCQQKFMKVYKDNSWKLSPTLLATSASPPTPLASLPIIEKQWEADCAFGCTRGHVLTHLAPYLSV